MCYVLRVDALRVPFQQQVLDAGSKVQGRSALAFNYLNAMAGEVQRWFDRLPEHWQERAQLLRDLVLDAAHGMAEKWMFKSAPFYLHHGWMCYFSFKDDQLIIGFCQGVHMLDEEALFALTPHKQIRHYLPPRPPARLNEGAFRRTLVEAVHINKMLAEERTAKRKRKR